ncbi:hypothetical protein D3C71_1450200 [compost metagenome]
MSTNAERRWWLSSSDTRSSAAKRAISRSVSSSALSICSVCGSSSPSSTRVRYRCARRRVSGVRRSWAMLSHTPLTSVISCSMRSSMALTMLDRRSISSGRPDTGRRWPRSPAMIRRVAASICWMRLSGRRRSRCQPARPGITVRHTPHSSASRMMLLTALSLPLWRTNTSSRPSWVFTPSARPGSRRVPVASCQPSTGCARPSMRRASGRATRGPASG